MANRNLTNEQCRINREDISLVFFSNDDNLAHITSELEEELRSINDYLVFYTNETLLMSYIESVRQEKIVLVLFVTTQIEVEAAVRLVTVLERESQIDIILLFSTAEHVPSANYSKINFVYHNERELLQGVRRNIDNLQQKLANGMDYRNGMGQKFVRELDKESAAYLHLHLFKDIVVNMSDGSAAKKAMLEQCRTYYADNQSQLALIDRFESTYRMTDAVRWYTKDCFIYRLVNKALRTENIEQLYMFRFYIADLSLALRALKREKQQHHDETDIDNITVYRGIPQSSQDLNTLRGNIGRIISMNGFLSASRDERVALSFAGNNAEISSNLVQSVVLEICVDMISPDVIAADITHRSAHPDECEILFDFGVTFRVDTVKYDEANGVHRCILVATNDGAKFVRDHVALYSNEMQATSSDIRFGGLLVDMCAYSQAKVHLQGLLKNSDRSDIAHIHFHLGRICHDQSSYEQSMEHLHKALELEQHSLNIARIMLEIGVLIHQRHEHVENDDYSGFIDWSERALELFIENGGADSLNAAYCLNNIGWVLNKRGDHARALDLHTRALRIRRSLLPHNHGLLAQSLRNIGMVHYELGDCDQALEFQTRALTIVQSTVPDVHWSQALTLRNIGMILYRQGNFNLAYEKLEKALSIFERAYGREHPTTDRTRVMLHCARDGCALPSW